MECLAAGLSWDMVIAFFPGDRGELCAQVGDEFAGYVEYDAHPAHASPVWTKAPDGDADLCCTARSRSPHLFVKAIEVYDEYQRQGVATALIAELGQRHAGHTLTWSHPQSHEGRRLIDSLPSPGELCRAPKARSTQVLA